MPIIAVQNVFELFGLIINFNQLYYGLQASKLAIGRVIIQPNFTADLVITLFVLETHLDYRIGHLQKN